MDFQLDRGSLLHGFRTFAAITVVAFVLLGVLTMDESTWQGLAEIRPIGVVLVAGLVFVSWFTTALKVRILASGIGSRIGVWTCFRAHMANMFLSAVTPFQTGGGAAQIYVLWREGLSISRATAASLVGALITIVLLFLTGIVVLLMRPTLVENMAFRLVTGFVIGVFGTVFFLFWIAFFKPARAQWVVRAAASLIARVPLLPADRVWRLHDRFAGELNDLVDYLRCYLTQRRGTLLCTLPLGAISILANCLIAHAVLFGMRVTSDVVEVLLAQVLIYFIIYFSPSPGGSGVAEAGGASLMAALVPTHYLAVYVVLWRFFTYLLGVGVGAVVIIGLLRRRAPSPEVSPPREDVVPGGVGELESVESTAVQGPLPGGET